MTASANDTATFAVKLEDQTSGPAASAASALADLKSKLDSQTRTLGEMQRAYRNIKGSTNASSDAFKALGDQIKAQKAIIASTQTKVLDLGGSFGKVEASGKSAFQELLDAANKMPGPLGALAGRVGSLSALFEANAPLVLGVAAFAAGALLAAAAVVTLTAAIVAGTASLLGYAIAQSEVRRNELLMLEGLTRRRNLWGLAAGSATELQAAIDRVSDSSALGRTEISGYAQSLYRMGLRGENLSEALEGMSIVGSTQGEQMARRFAGMAVGAARFGGSVRRVTDDARARLGDLANRQAAGLGKQLEKLRENVGHIFDGLEIDGFLRGLRMVTSLFSQSTASGRALKALVGIVFQPMLDQLEHLGPIAKRFFQGLVIGALRLTITFLRIRNAILRTFADSNVLEGIDGMRVALFAGQAVVFGLAGAFLVLAGAVALLVAPFALAFVAGYKFMGFLHESYNVLRDVDWGALGTSLIEGLVRGLRRGRDLVVNTVRGLATSATDALTSALGIHSPSRVFANLGVQIPRGLAAGVDAGTPSAQGAVESMVSVPAESGAGASSRGAVMSFSFGDIHIGGHGGESGRAMAESFREELVRVLQGAALEMGAA